MNLCENHKLSWNRWVSNVAKSTFNASWKLTKSIIFDGLVSKVDTT